MSKPHNHNDLWHSNELNGVGEQERMTLPSAVQPTLYSISELVISQSSVLFDMTGRQVNINQLRPGIYFLHEGRKNRKIVVLH